jgi:hypothetical protein
MKMYELVGKDFRKTDDIEKSKSTSLFLTSYGEVSVSTVFLGWDHSFGSNSEPILFETMVFEGVYNEYQVRYHTYDEAEQGHKYTCEMISDDPIVIEFLRNQKIGDLLK